MKNKLSTIVENMPPSGIRKFFDLVLGAKDIISLGVGEPDFSTPWRIREEAYHKLELGKTCYTSNLGMLDLREAVSNFLKENFNCQYDPNCEILITVGVSEGIDIALRSIINPGDEVIIPEPCFVSYKPMVSLAGGTPVSIDTSKNNFKLTAEQLEEKITPKTKALLICYPNNPTGASFNKEELQKIADIAIKHDILVLSDEIYGELNYETEHTCISSLQGMKERTILFNGYSKAYAMTGWRIAYMCGPKDIMAAAVKVHQYSIMCAPIMSQYAALEATLNAQQDVAHMKKSYKQRRNIFVEGMNKIGLSTHIPEGALYAFPCIKSTGLSSEEFAIRLLQEQKVAVVPGNAFGDAGEGYIRCCYATEISQLKEAIKKIGIFVESLN